MLATETEKPLALRTAKDSSVATMDAAPSAVNASTLLMLASGASASANPIVRAKTVAATAAEGVAGSARATVHRHVTTTPCPVRFPTSVAMTAPVSRSAVPCAKARTVAVMVATAVAASARESRITATTALASANLTAPEKPVGLTAVMEAVESASVFRTNAWKAPVNASRIVREKCVVQTDAAVFAAPVRALRMSALRVNVSASLPVRV